MIISKIKIKNLRAIKNLEVDFDDITILVGPNGAGKTTVLEAIEIFFVDKKIDENDFHKNKTDEEIEVSLTFKDIDKRFSEINPNGEIMKRISNEENKIKETHYAIIPTNEDFKKISSMLSNDYKRQYKVLRETYPDLPSKLSSIDEMRKAIEKYEIDNKEEMKTTREKEISNDFSEFIDIISVQALKDPNAEIDESKSNSTLSKLIDMVIKQNVKETELIKGVEEHAIKEYNKLKNDSTYDALKIISEGTTRIMKDIAPNIEVEFNWEETSTLKIKKPQVEVKIKENEFLNYIEKSGHGSQRLFLYVLLRYYHENKTETKEEKNPKHVLIIDEPELYQHPIRKIALYNILKALTDKFQIIYSTHSAKFFSMDNIENLRFFEKNEKNINIRKITHDAIFKKMKKNPKKYMLKKRLDIIETQDFKESLFSKKVVLVEGQSDKIILEKIAKRKEINLPILGISIVSCGGKSGIGEQIPIYQILNIPVYVMWDIDGSGSKEKNDKILDLLNVKIPNKYDTVIGSSYAYFKTKIEDDMIQCMGNDDEMKKYKEEVSKETKTTYNSKTAFLAALLIDKIYDNDYRLSNIEKILEKIKNLTN